MGYHAIIDGGTGDWAASATSGTDAVQKCVGRHIMGKALADTESLGKCLRMDVREVGNGLWKVELQAVDLPPKSPVEIVTEALGSEITREKVERSRVPKSIGRRMRNAVAKVAAMICLA